MRRVRARVDHPYPGGWGPIVNAGADCRPRPSEISPRSDWLDVARRKRATTTGRGYGIHHQRTREHWAVVVSSGTAICPRCNKPILPTQAWDLDHRDDRRGYLGVSHSECNRGAGNRRQGEIPPKPKEGFWYWVDVGAGRWERCSQDW